LAPAREACRKLGYRAGVITLASLHTYPVKSCRGIAHSTTRLTEAGLEHDREWMFVGPGGRFVTQREIPGLARVDVALGEGTLRLSASGAGGVGVSLDFQGARSEVNVWGDLVGAFDQGEEVAAWASALFGRELRLVRFDREARRFSSRDWTGGIEAPNRFSDGYPLLVVSRASLDDLNSRLPVPLPMDRFRPNLVLEGLPPYGEDSLRDLVADGVRLRVVKPCTRCVITTTDQQQGAVAGDEPVRTLRAYRWDAGLRGVTFGQNTIVVEGAGETLRAGMRFG
jgi:MOSC domain-containing protein